MLSYVTSASEEELLLATVCLSETTAKPLQPRHNISVRKMIDILEMPDKDATTTEVTTQFTVRKTVVGCIKRDRARILEYSSSGGDLTVTRIPPTTRAKVNKKIRNVSLENKLAILDRPGNGAPGKAIAADYGITKDAVSQIKKTRRNFIAF
ncbi:hypothetical protein GN958_ATG05116 [Phytophthora infestans]|uniref:Uncharacterized protein n=1 Tax=Phytophthora infestans TaxID=4787 RepID=A0A8S9UED3_PHYIN|nr:hypothetical protein GN958_ATG11807 [Phytophthora infestans]KAF4145692.1 hypothetical protein GN958_ATG05116 [Phytophthora infestans]